MTRISDKALLKILAIAWAGIFFMGLWQNYYSEIRWVRDATHRTPFHSVTVDKVRPDGRAIYVSGTMIKRRCEFRGLYAYAVSGGVLYPAVIDTTPEDGLSAPRTRPASPDVQTWGEWLIVARDVARPDYWRIYAAHLCPEDKIQQSNLFATGPWRDYKKADQ